MMQHKFLLFSAVCCCLLQALLCDSPPSLVFRQRSRKSSLFPTTSTTGPISSDETQQNVLSRSDTLSPSIKQEKSSAVSPTDAPSNPAKRASEKKSTSMSTQKQSSVLSRTSSSAKDPLDITDLDELKERSKELLRDLLRNENANKAITFMTRNARATLENESASHLILTQVRLKKEILTDPQAVDVIKNIRLNIFNTCVNPAAPAKVQVALGKSKEWLSKKDLPQLITKRFKILKKIINNKQTYPAAQSLQKFAIKFLNDSNIKMKIAKLFRLLDFAINFDPNNLLKSFTGFSFFK